MTAHHHRYPLYPEGERENLLLFMDLVKKADVVAENFRADVKHRLGIDYESVRKVNPRIIYASISGFGQEGPYSDRPGVDQIVQGEARSWNNADRTFGACDRETVRNSLELS